MIQSDRCNKKNGKDCVCARLCDVVRGRPRLRFEHEPHGCFFLNTNLTNHTNVFFLYRLHELHGFFFEHELTRILFFSTDYTNYTDYFCLRINTNLVSFLQNYRYTLFFYSCLITPTSQVEQLMILSMIVKIVELLNINKHGNKKKYFLY